MSKISDRLQAKVTRLYIDMRLKRISKLNWMIETEETLEALKQLEHTDIAPELFYIQLLITKEAYEAADELLEEAAEWLRLHSQASPACHAYYLYLTTLVREDAEYDERVALKLSELARKHPSIWQIQWLLYYVDRALIGQPLEQYHFLKRMFITGCRSPLMYLEARTLLERNPTFLYEFSEFEVQLMVFMIRHAGMSERVSDILAEYMLKRTDYRYLYLIILCGCYEVKPSKPLLEGICRMMVLGSCVGERFTLWYRKGIAENVHVAGLFEAFMKSLPVEQWSMDGEELSDVRRIPSEALEYFAHASGPDAARTAYLYAVVHKYKDNWFSTYKLYEPLIQPFMMDQLYKGHINAGLAYLYENVLQPSQLPKERLEGFLDICYTCRVGGLPITAGTLLVRYAHWEHVVRAPFNNGEAVLPLYGEQFVLSVENYNGCEMPAPEAYVRPMFNKSIWRSFLEEQEFANILYHMSQVEDALKNHMLEERLSNVKLILAEESIPLSFKEETAAVMLPYWDINGNYDEILRAVPYVFVELGAYSKSKETLFWKGQYLRNHIGIYGMKFLLDHYEGTLAEMGGIFTKAMSLGVETGAFAEHLLCEMIEKAHILPQHLEILDAYCKSDANAELVQAYLEFEAEYCYMQEQKLAQLLLHRQAVLTVEGKAFSTIAQLAFLESLAEAGVGNCSQEIIGAAEAYIRALLKQNIYFSWMQPLKVICPLLASKEAFQVLEYRGQVTGPVWVRFSQYSEGKEDAESLQSEVMDMICEGVYAKPFILFYSERMHYEIFGLEGTEHKLLRQGVMQRGKGAEEAGNSRFSRLNHMLALKEKRDNWELYQELEAYYGQSAMVEQLFVLK